MTRPPEPPKTPSDLVPHDVVAGRVTRGGSGPCYGLVTEDGTEYAMHSTVDIPWSKVDTSGSASSRRPAGTTAGTASRSTPSR